MGLDKITHQAHYVLMNAESSQQFPSKTNDLELWCEALADSIKTTRPAYFITLEQPYVVGEALIYALSRNIVKGDDAIVLIYYLLVKSTRNETYPPSCVTVAKMLAFAFLDEHKEVIGKKLKRNHLQHHNVKEVDETISYQINGQLSAFYWSFEEFDYEDYIYDFSLMSWVDKAVRKYRQKFDGYDQANKQRTIDFVNENSSMMLENIERHWEDLPEQ